MAKKQQPQSAAPVAIRDRVIDFRRVPASQLLPNPRNWRLHNDAQRLAFRALLDQVGFAGAELVRVLPDGRLQLIDGHMRQEELGDTPLPCLVTDLSESEADALLASFDPIARLAGTDHDAVAALIASLDSDGYGGAAQLLAAVAAHDQTAALLESLADGMLAGESGDQHEVDDPSGGGDDFDTTPDESGPTRCQPGDLWQLGAHRLLCGDSTRAEDVARLMDGAEAQLVVTSPPYNQQLDTFKPSGMQRENPAFVRRMASAYADSMPEDVYQSGQVAMLEMLHNFLTADGSIFYNHKIRYRGKSAVSPMQWLSRLSFPVRQEIIWDRGSSITLNARMFVPADERIYWLRVGSDFVFNDTPEVKAWGTVWTVAARNEVQVSAAFAVEIPARCIMAASRDGEVVLEPYCGSGTTLIAAERLGRRCYGIEIDPRYCDVILRRWETETGREAVLLERAG